MGNSEPEISDAKTALDDSSRLNRRLFLVFLVFEVYMLIVVGNTSDIQLLVPASKVRLPIANIDIPLFVRAAGRP